MKPISNIERNIRTRLKEIQENKTLSIEEKNRQCQEVMSRGIQTNNVISEPNCNESCSHYVKGCSNFFFDCCQTVDPCNRCHLARECCQTKPPSISSIKCNTCKYSQIPSNTCIQCTTKFSNSFCDICKIWTSAEIFHCVGCGICRVGKEGSLFHCDNCEACFSVLGRKEHKCAKQSLKDNVCSYCLESVHTSQKESHILECCGLVLHRDCSKSALRSGDYRCPSCRKSQCEMKGVWSEVRANIRMQPLPLNMMPALTSGDMVRSPYGILTIQEIFPSGNTEDGSENRMFRGTLSEWQLSDGSYPVATVAETDIDQTRLVNVWCNDCEKRCVTPFHFIGLECRFCRGYNTSKA